MVILINLFCYQLKVSILMNTWIAGKNLMKHDYHLKKYFSSELNLEGISDEDYAHA